MFDAGDRLPAAGHHMHEDEKLVPALLDEGASAARATRVDPRLLEILICPVTRSGLSYDAKRQELISRAAKLAYPIRGGIPIMLPGEARAIDGAGD